MEDGSIYLGRTWDLLMLLCPSYGGQLLLCNQPSLLDSDVCGWTAINSLIAIQFVSQKVNFCHPYWPIVGFIRKQWEKDWNARISRVYRKTNIYGCRLFRRISLKLIRRQVFTFHVLSKLAMNINQLLNTDYCFNCL